MPSDKWNHPFIYPTAENAGVTGTGNAFFWQQANNIFDDSDDGMVRIGKEYDQVQVISTTTGEWEFPYDTADYYCLESHTGHHSGGETHGCEGAEYNANVTINESPPRFYFQKQMWHGGSKIEHPGTGKFTDPRITEQVVGNGFKGFCLVRYNKKDGRSAGHDSVILEIWWNDDPDADKTKWFMVKRIEDKGGWGTGGTTCDGVDDQVFTWSNVQMRYKSGTPEWSVHPIIPEFEDGANIHSIGSENMSFADSENRGYGKDAREPRDIEMKIVFKFASNNGIARLKNASIREIDASKTFDETPNTPPPGEEPTDTTTIQGKFTLKWDLNTARVSACAGTGGGGGAGGLTKFYTLIADETNDKELSNSTTFSNRTRVAQKVAGSGSILFNKLVKQLDVYLKKSGTPGATPTVSAKIWNAANTVVYTSTTTFDPSAFTTSFVKKSFDFSTNTHVLVVGDKIGIQYDGTSSTNYVLIMMDFSATYDGTNSYISQYEASVWDDKSTRDLAADIWE